MNTLKYKGFIGSVAFSEEDNVFFGKIEGIDGLVNFEGESVEELKNAFHEAVNDYVAYLAKQTGVSINAFIKKAVEKQVAGLL